MIADSTGANGRIDLLLIFASTDQLILGRNPDLQTFTTRGHVAQRQIKMPVKDKRVTPQ
jgi:hypothetical protein